MITLVCCLVVSFICGFTIAYNLREEVAESGQDRTDLQIFMSVLSTQNNTFSLMPLVFLLFSASRKSTNLLSQK